MFSQGFHFTNPKDAALDLDQLDEDEESYGQRVGRWAREAYEGIRMADLSGLVAALTLAILRDSGYRKGQSKPQKTTSFCFERPLQIRS